MNNLYQWHDEQTVKYEMQEAYWAAEQSRLLKEAGLSQPGLLVRAVNALRSLWAKRKKNSQDQGAGLSRVYRSASDKLSR